MPASTLASSPTAFLEWRKQAGIHVYGTSDPILDLSQSNSITQLLNTITALPAWTNDANSAAYQSVKWEQLHSLRNEFIGAQLPEPSVQISAEDSQALERSLPVILETCYSLNKIAEYAGLRPNEATWRLPCDTLISHTFRMGQGDLPLMYLNECELSLPETGPTFPSTATADACLFFRRTRLFETPTPENAPLANEAACFNVSAWPNLYILQWACEHNGEQEGQYRLIMDLTSAQYQRRSLGIDNDVVYGAHAVRGVMHIYASWWHSKQIKCKKLLELDLKRPRPAVQFYMFLRKVLSHANSNQSTFEGLSEHKLRTAQAAYKGSWKAERQAGDLHDAFSGSPLSSDGGRSDVQQEDDESMKSTTTSTEQEEGEEGRTESSMQEDVISDGGRRSVSPTAAELDRVKRQRLDHWTGTPPTVVEWIQKSESA